MRFYVYVDDGRVLAALKDSRRELSRDVRDALLTVAERIVVPRAKAFAPSIVRRTIIARATARDAYLTTTSRGKARRLFGYLNFGGTVKTTILPRKGRRLGRSTVLIGSRGHAPALRMPDGRYVARVTTTRKFAGLHFLERSVEEQRSFIGELVKERVAAAIQRNIDQAVVDAYVPARVSIGPGGATIR